MGIILRFSIKSGILLSAVYYSKQAGFWADSSRTYNLSRELITFLLPYIDPAVKRVQNELPVQIDELPSSDDICRSVSSNWNKGVIRSISFTQKLPCILNSYIKQGSSYIQNELRKN